MSETNPRIGRVGMFRARREGVQAALDGKPVTACPYKIAGNFEERTKARFWIRGHARTETEMQRRGVEGATQAP